MAIVEICCPNCGSASVKKDGSEYCCNNCGRYFQIIKSRKPPSKPKVFVNQQVKYGKTTLELPNLKNVGRFVLAKATLNFNPSMVFKFHVFKQIKRGNTTVEADLRGYFFTNPFTGKLNDVQYSDKGYHPQPNNVKDDLERECVRIIIDKAFEEKAPIENENSPPMPPMALGEKIQQDVFNWITSNLSVKKTYAVQSTRRYDLGLREVILSFKKKDVLEFGSLGVIAVPLFKLEYMHPDSSAIFKRDFLGYSGELVLDEIKCSKSNFFDSTCYDFPNNVCRTCGKLICDNHTKKCERCGATVCKDCAVTKGLLSKHYYCSSCAG